MTKAKFIIFIVFTIVNIIAFNAQEKLDIKTNREIASTSKKIPDINFRRNFFSLDHSHGYRGLFHNGDDSEFITRLFGQIIQSADKLAKEDWYHPEENIYKHYNLFLLLSLVVPSHESALSHFTLREKSKYCYFSNDVLNPIHPKDHIVDFYQKAIMNLDSGAKGYAKQKRRFESKIRNANFLTKYYPVFKKAMGEIPFELKHCDNVNSNNVYQLMFSGDYADIGMFMLNAKSHGDFFARGGILNFDQVREYALKFLYSGFHKISLNSEDYDCLKDLSKHDFEEYSQNILKGAWAGRYNSGNTGKTCRFKNPSDKFYSNDISYARSLKKFFKPTERKISLFEKLLPLESIERKAFAELMENVKNQTNNRTYLDQVMSRNYHSESNSILTDKNDRPLDRLVEDNNLAITDDVPAQVEDLDEPGYVNFDVPLLEQGEFITLLTNKNTNIRKSPKILSDNVCGNTKKSDYLPIEVSVQEIEGSWVKVNSEELLTLIKDECVLLESLYVHKSLVKLQKKNNNTSLIKINEAVVLRDVRGTKNSTIIGNLGPGEKAKLVQTYLSQDQYIWVEIILSNGEKAWFYAGEINAERFSYL